MSAQNKACGEKRRAHGTESQGTVHLELGRGREARVGQNTWPEKQEYIGPRAMPQALELLNESR